MTLAQDLFVARAAGERASAILLAGWGAAGTVQHKGGNPADLVTEFDRRSEEAIIATIREASPDDAILGEEGGGRPGTSGRRWLVDPIDGTTNFAHGLPMFAASIALEVQGELVAGVLAAPALGWTFWAARGMGAWLESDRGVRRLAVSGTAALAGALLATGFPTTTSARAHNFAAFEAVYRRSQGVRRIGAAALDLAFVAAGWIDAYWEAPLHPWDLGAGVVLVREAGGRVTDLSGGAFRVDDGQVVASNGRLHDELVRELGGVLDRP